MVVLIWICRLETTRKRMCRKFNIQWGRDKAKKKGATLSASSTCGNKKALAKLMVNEYVSRNESYKAIKSSNVEAFLEIKKELELMQQELKMQEIE
uniref:Uncharacterized protein n=1 Tax=Tanacetum cinerariifolium TaxID=118510 RepID=A0A699QWU4_TANCI|nr:hypothetical protein [Tanacetum cinerariifolium]